MTNILLEQVEYKIEETPFGVWRRYLSPTGAYFSEFRSHRTYFGLPLVHFTRGICPDTGKRIVARGIIAVGRLAAGVLAIGHASFGLLAFGQLALGLLLGLGQATTGLLAVGQLAFGGMSVGQVAVGMVSIGQIAVGKFALGQIGVGDHVWSTEHVDPVAVQFFRELLERVSAWL